MKCPKCGRLYDSLFGRTISSGVAEFRCYRCNYKTKNIEDWLDEERKVLAFRCEKCGDYVENTADNRNLCGFFKEIVCPKCLIVVGINGKHIREQGKISQKDLDKTEKIGENLHIFHAKTNRQKVLLRILNIAARKEETSFKNMPRPKTEKADVNQYVMLSKERLIGYLSFVPKWRDGTPLLNQLYVTPDDRRKGYATKLLQYFIQKNCDTKSNVWFIAESPNKKGYGLIVEKLGLGENVTFVSLG